MKIYITNQCNSDINIVNVIGRDMFITLNIIVLLLYIIINYLLYILNIRMSICTNVLITTVTVNDSLLIQQYNVIQIYI